MNNWVLVVDDDSVSRRQVKTCTELKIPDLMSLDCSTSDNTESRVCNNVDYFPAFCNTATNKCHYGMRTTKRDIMELTATKQTKDPK